MQGARERNVLRWDAHRALLDAEVERLERELAAAAPNSPHAAALLRQLEDARARRDAIGPSPRPKMG